MRAAIRGAITALSIVAVLATPAVATVSATAEDAPVEVDRLAGANRYETAAMLSAQFPEAVDTVYLANGENWTQGADAVVAGAAAGSGTVPPLVTEPSGNPAPILLVKGTGIPSATRAALAELRPSTAVILGGPAVVLPVVDQELLAAGITPIRVFGVNRYGTAAALAATFEPGFETVYVASGTPIVPRPPYIPLMPDALVASARAGAEDAPVLLTKSSELPRVTREVLEAMDPPSITIVGGSGTVSDPVAHELSLIAPVTRVKGETRYLTAAALFESYPSGGPTSYLASGEWFADSLAVSALAASEGAPVLLANRTRLPGGTAERLVALDPDAVRFVGGPTMLDDYLMIEVRDLLDSAP